MEFIFSTPDSLDFFMELRNRIKAQRERVWVASPFLDHTGAALLNESTALDTRLLTRRNRHTGDLGSGLAVKLQPNLHTKLWIMDDYAMIGSPNLTQESLIDNIEFLVVRDDRGLEELLRSFVGVKR